MLLRALWKSACAALAALALVTALAAESAPARPVRARQVSASAWFVQGEAALGSPANRNFISNAGFVVTPAGVVVIDALGSPQLARELIAEIRRVTPLPITHVILTHYHADHIYGLQEFRKIGAHIIAERHALDYLNSDVAAKRLAASRVELAPWIDANTQLVAPDEVIDAPHEVVVGGVHLLLQPVGPAHTADDLVIYLPAERVLFAGDLVFRGRVPYVGDADSGHWITALDTLLKIDPAIVVPGHGDYSTQAREDLQLTRDYLAYLREAMGRAARNMDPFEQAYAQTDWSRFEHLPLFRVANRMNAYNTYLLMENEAK